MNSRPVLPPTLKFDDAKLDRLAMDLERAGSDVVDCMRAMNAVMRWRNREFERLNKFSMYVNVPVLLVLMVAYFYQSEIVQYFFPEAFVATVGPMAPVPGTKSP